MMQGMKFAMAAAVLLTTSACKTSHPDTRAAASDTAQSSLCLIDRKLPLRPAPTAGIDDPGNRYDTDEMTAAAMEHNARYDAACPKSGREAP